MKIRNKIAMGFIVTFFIGFAMGCYGLFSINNLAKMSDSQVNYRAVNSSISEVLHSHYTWRQELTVAMLTGSTFEGSYDPKNCTLGKWRNSEEAIATTNEEIILLLNKIDTPHALMHEKAFESMALIENGDRTGAIALFNSDIVKDSEATISILKEMSSKYEDMLNTKIFQMHTFEENSIRFFYSLMIVSVIACILAAFFIMKNIMRPIEAITKTAKMVSYGNFNNVYEHKVDDEIGALSNNFNYLTTTFRRLMDELQVMSQNHTKGDIDYFMNTDHFEGEFKDVVENINMMVAEYTDNIKLILNTVSEYAEGNFDAKLRSFPGKKASATTILNTVSKNLNDVRDSVIYLATAASKGELHKRADATKFKGDWQKLIQKLNDVLQNVNIPLKEISSVMDEFSVGNLSIRVNGKYDGEFAKVKNSVNETTDSISSYMTEINDILHSMSEGNLKKEITRNYAGDFATIKESINMISKVLSNTVFDISSASSQVLEGAKVISATSMYLAEGATEQSETVQRITENAKELNNQTKINSSYTTEVNKLSEKSMANATKASEEMKKLLLAIESIETSSRNIYNVIKVIDGIAFQTNLLALNAAVEAARAGTHGKGFAVVAEEVRNLAARCQKAAAETTHLIEDSIRKVDDGARNAEGTSQALDTIIEDALRSSNIILEIFKSSNAQAEAIAHISEGLDEVSKVIFTNSSTSEETASASEELNTQAELLKNMVRFFKI